MKVTFVGGGSLRLLPILRGVFKRHKAVFEDGEVRLVDLDLTSASLVGRMVMKTPEHRALDSCKVSWTDNLDAALEGTDMLYVTMAVGDRLHSMRANQASHRLGFMSSDQLSPQGALRALIGGKTILGFARKMERICPDALLLDFANPVAVYSGMVNNHTKVKALGICGGYANHRYDLTRIIFGDDEARAGYDVDVAGVNHCSLLLRGAYNGQDIYKLLDKRLESPWAPPESCAPILKLVLHKMVDMYRKFGVVIFSTELDGFAHPFYEEACAWQQDAGQWKHLGEAEMLAQCELERKQRAASYQLYADNVDKDLPDSFWASGGGTRLFGVDRHDVTLPILNALAGHGSEKIVASAPNRGAVAGFKDRHVIEYSMVIGKDGAVPAGQYEIPDAFHGLMSSLACHQTLLGDAVATRDPKLLAEAFFAYPIHQNTQASRQLFKELLAIHEGEYAPELKSATDYL